MLYIALNTPIFASDKTVEIVQKNAGVNQEHPFSGRVEKYQYMLHSMWENYQEPVWQITALKICFDVWLIFTSFNSLFPSSQRIFKGATPIDQKSQEAQTIKSILGV